MEVWKGESNFEHFSLRSLFGIQVDMLMSKLKLKGKLVIEINFENPQDYQMFS